VTGGNLVAAGGLLLIATPDKLMAFDQRGKRPPATAAGVARRIPNRSAAAVAEQADSKQTE
jgi:hypothetical protein